MQLLTKKNTSEKLVTACKINMKFVNGLSPPLLHETFVTRENLYNLRKYSLNKRTVKLSQLKLFY